MDQEADSGLLNIALSDSEDSAPETEKEAAGSSSGPKADRNAQSEEAFEKVRAEYQPRIENGEIWSNIQFPLPSTVSKPQAQDLLHAVEELYFFRRHAEGARFVRKIFSEEGNPEGLDEDTKKLLRYYEAKCIEKAKLGPEA